MTELKNLVAPELEEAVNGVLYVHNLKDPTQAKVQVYVGIKEGQEVELIVTTPANTNNPWRHLHRVTSSDINNGINFGIPKEVFEKGLVPSALAKLAYVVFDEFGNPHPSPDLIVRLER